MKIETELVRSARLGDKESFAQVYDQVATDLYKVALYTLGNAHDAEDVVSETFIEAYKGIKNLRDDSSFKPWIMRILSIRCKRRIGGYVKEKGNVDIEECINAPAEEGDLAGSASERVTVLQALGSLSEQERLIISLAVMQGYTTREVSEMLNIPHGTVSSKLHRSLIKLRKILEEGERSERDDRQ